jgi:hypothetical protein
MNWFARIWLRQYNPFCDTVVCPMDNVVIKNNYDLEIEWENGAVLNCFANDSEKDSYYFYDSVNLKSCGFR